MIGWKVGSTQGDFTQTFPTFPNPIHSKFGIPDEDGSRPVMGVK